MWLDRFSNSSTPPSISIDSSSLSLPRRPYLSQRASPSSRPPLDSRTSTLSVASAASTTRPSTNKNTEPIFILGSDLAADEAASAKDDALKALESVVGPGVEHSQDRVVSEIAPITPYEAAPRPSLLNHDIDFEGLSLSDYMRDGSDDDKRKQRIALESDHSVENCMYGNNSKTLHSLMLG